MSLAVQLQDMGNVVAAVGAPLILADLLMLLRGNSRPAIVMAAFGFFAIGDAINGIGWLLVPNWAQAALSFALAAFFAWGLWRRYKGRRKRAAALLGAKSKALRDALVRKAREAAQPRPVLRPVPGGAQCS